MNAKKDITTYQKRVKKLKKVITRSTSDSKEYGKKLDEFIDAMEKYMDFLNSIRK